mmetsp:Transcript_3264/g.11291  ORF Transcript_3264/g.11291 Transcript_3264/m.11291 type:complete len:330 (+) Transcript_3264:140-1129(+)
MALPRAQGDCQGRHPVRARRGVHRGPQAAHGGEARGPHGGSQRRRGAGSAGALRVAVLHGHGLLGDGHDEHYQGDAQHDQPRAVPAAAVDVPHGEALFRGAQPVHAARGDRRGAAHRQGGVPHQPRQGPGFDRADPRRGEGALPGAQDAGQHAQVRHPLLQQLHRARGHQEQGPHLPVPREQVRHGQPHRLLQRRAHVALRGGAAAAGGGAPRLLRHGGGTAQERGRHGERGAGAAGSGGGGRQGGGHAGQAQARLVGIRRGGGRGCGRGGRRRRREREEVQEEEEEEEPRGGRGRGDAREEEEEGQVARVGRDRRARGRGGGLVRQEA